MTQSERLNYLVRSFIEDSEHYKNMEVPADTEGKRTLLRSLMNIRMPKAMDEEILKVQDEYLQERAREVGVVPAIEIPTVAELGSKAEKGDQIAIWQGDITRIGADAIVNAANSQMLGCFVPMHTCIDNCIHTFAGVQLRAECENKMRALRKKYGREYEQPTAVPMITSGYNLPAKHVIHVVGPIVYGRLTTKLERQLGDCYRNTLKLCDEYELTSVAFCCISTGVFLFPNERASSIAVEEVTSYLRETGSRIKVIFNVFKNEDLDLYRKQLELE
ncbi:MAG: protein-ADP-ribose hydrolase [Oscillospiraceae bacterium]|nr:protein-ADP-ribose hydrolase [Oscillospiraceae bacterium]